MHLSFVLAVIALTVSLVSADSDSQCPSICDVDAHDPGCCDGYDCVPVVVDNEVSMSSFHLHNHVTHRPGRAMKYMSVSQSNRDSGSCFCFRISVVWLTP